MMYHHHHRLVCGKASIKWPSLVCVCVCLCAEWMSIDFMRRNMTKTECSSSFSFGEKPEIWATNSDGAREWERITAIEWRQSMWSSFTARISYSLHYRTKYSLCSGLYNVVDFAASFARTQFDFIIQRMRIEWKYFMNYFGCFWFSV